MARYDDVLIRGALVNLLGLIAKLVHPIFLVIVTLLYGTDAVGLYLLASAFVQVASSAVTAGYNDATTLFASQHIDDQDKLDQVLANGFAISLGIALSCSAGLLLAGPWIAGQWFADRLAVGTLLQVLAFALPFQALGRIGIAATKARLDMRYDALTYGLIEPLVLLVSAVAAWVLDGGAQGLCVAFVVAQLLACGVGLWSFSREFEIARVLRAIRHFQWHGNMLRFALPQNLNRTLGVYLTRLDIIMLAALGASNTMVGLYGTAALLTSHLRQIRLLFSGALGPIVARLRGHENRVDLIRHLSVTSRWTISLVAPIVLVLLVLHADVFRWIDPVYASAGTTFFLILLISPVLNCGLGLVGNCIVYTHHTQFNLLNSLLVAGLNTGLNWVLIPALGMVGAALATVIAVACISILQVIELRMLEQLWIRLVDVWLPWLGLGFLATILVVLQPTLASVGVLVRIITALAVVVIFALLMLAGGHPEVVAITRRLWPSPREM